MTAMLQKLLPQLELRLTAEGPSAHKARDAVRKLIADHQIDESRAYDILLAVGEAVGNAIEHAYRSGNDPASNFFTIRAAIVTTPKDRELVINVTDCGSWKAPVESDERGHGMMIMRSLSKDLQVSRSSTHTDVRMTFSIKPPVDFFVARAA